MQTAPRTRGRRTARTLLITVFALLAVSFGPTHAAGGQSYAEGPDYNFFYSQYGPPINNTIRDDWNLYGGPTQIPYYIHDHVIASGFRQPVRNAFKTIEDDPNSKISFVYMGSTSTLSELRITNGACCPSPSDDINVVSFGSLPAGFIGLGGFAGSFGIDASGNPNGTGQGKFDLTLSNTTTFAIGPASGAIDVESLVLHELGHAIGLDHPTVNTATVMWDTLLEGSTKRALHPADLQGMSLLYPCGQDSFSDTPAGEWFSDAVQWAGCNDITNGTPAGAFQPDGLVSRAEMATFLWRYAGEPAAGPHGFTDVPAGQYFSDPVKWLSESGITSGTTTTTFSPAATVSRAQMATFLWRFAGEPAWPTSSGFVDVPSTEYYATPVAWMAGTGITQGTSSTTFSPDATLTRAQAVTFLLRLNDLL